MEKSAQLASQRGMHAGWQPWGPALLKGMLWRGGLSALKFPPLGAKASAAWGGPVCPCCLVLLQFSVASRCHRVC